MKRLNKISKIVLVAMSALGFMLLIQNSSNADKVENYSHVKIVAVNNSNSAKGDGVFKPSAKDEKNFNKVLYNIAKKHKNFKVKSNALPTSWGNASDGAITYSIYY